MSAFEIGDRIVFSVGDRIVCTDISGSGSAGLELFKAYNVDVVEDHVNESFVRLAGLEGSSYRSCRFILEVALAVPARVNVRTNYGDKCLAYLKAGLQECVDDPAHPDDKYELGYQQALENILEDVFGLAPKVKLVFMKAGE